MSQPTKMLIQDFLINSAGRFPNKEAIIHGSQRYTYADLLTVSNALAAWLLSGNSSPGFRAAILTDDPFEYISSYFAILRAGGIVVGLNTQTTGRTLRTLLNDCAPAVLFCHARFSQQVMPVIPDAPSVKAVVINGAFSRPEKSTAELFDRAELLSACRNDNITYPAVTPQDIAQIIYTSGTTGEPKGVMLRHTNLVANTKAIVEYLELTEQDRVMAVLPFFYSYGNSVLLTHFSAGGTLVVNQSFLYPNVILDEMVKEKVTGFSGVPSTFAILLHRSAIHNYVFPDLRYVTQAGAAMSPLLAHNLQEVVPHARIYIMYGQTEASARLSYLPPEDIYRKAGSIGKAIPGVTLQLLNKQGHPVGPGETGEIVANGENIMAGYWEKPEETAKVLRPEGLWTGDLAHMDNEGYFYIVSRKSDMIKSGSHRISPKEIEEVIMEHEAIHEAAVIGKKDEILGEAILACIVPKEGIVCTEKEILRHCRKNLPAYKIPHCIQLLPELPKTATGKIRKAELRDGASC